MKRILILAAALMAITGCYEDPMSGTGTGDPCDIVAFSTDTDTDTDTRGTPIRDASMLDDIGTFGYYTGQDNWTEASLPNRMFNRRLYRDGTAWAYDGIAPVRWDGNAADDLFTFYAYAPYVTADNGIVVLGDDSSEGIPTLVYTVPEDVTKQPDLMVAIPQVDIVKPASGFVSLNMQHALTTIGFQVAGNGEKITGLSVSGVSATGTLKMNGGNIEWADLDTPDAEFGALINFDDDESYYTATPVMSTGLMADNGYLMMIPQTLGDNAVLVVYYADGTSIEINIDPHEWLPGKKITYELTIVQGGVIVVEPSEILMPYVMAESRILVDCSTLQGDPAPTLEWTLTTSEPWLTFSLDSNGTGAGRTVSGAGTQTVYVFASFNGTGANRTATITLNGEENVVTTVVQNYSAAQRFARSNIVMYIDGNGNKILTFAETEADHKVPKSVTYYDASTSSTVTGTVPAIAANVQGLHFRWGSLVGVTSNGTHNTPFSSSHVVFWPTEYTPPNSWVFNSSGLSVPGQIPYANESMGNPADAFDGYPDGIGQGFDKAAAKGDICRYISDMGWVKGKWRMPTTADIISLLAETLPFYGYNGRVIGSWDENYQAISGTGSNNQYGYFRIPDVRIVGIGVTGSETASNSLPNPGAAKVVFPASGYRNSSDGRLYEPGYYAHHWTATASGSGFAYVLDYNGTQNYHSANNFSRANGYSVRCIMDE